MATTAASTKGSTRSKPAGSAGRTRSTRRDGGSSNGAQARGTGSTGLVVGAAAAGILAGIVANLGRKAVVQGVSAMSGDWFDALKTEHDLTRRLFDAIEATGDTQKAKRGMLLMQLKHALTKHAIEEENAVYPALRDAGQAEQADDLNRDHGYVKQFLYTLTMKPKDDPTWISTVREFRSQIEDHMREEEQEIFPALRARLGADQNAALTAAMNKEGFKVA